MSEGRGEGKKKERGKKTRGEGLRKADTALDVQRERKGGVMPHGAFHLFLLHWHYHFSGTTACYVATKIPGIFFHGRQEKRQPRGREEKDRGQGSV